jgi:hypothetical protein
MKDSMKTNFPGRVKNFPQPIDPFISVYEAISNSLQSIESKGLSNGFIKIIIERQNNPLVEGNLFPILNIHIVDNGEGFTPDNYKSFSNLDSDFKEAIGGKGIGRLNWLKIFDAVDINSVYEFNSKRMKKSFNFSIDNQIDNLMDSESNDDFITKVILRTLKPSYYGLTTIKTTEIANKIIEHFTSLFVIGLTTLITIEDGEVELNVNDYFNNTKYIKSHLNKIVIDGDEYDLRHVFLKSASSESHRIFVCAQKRVVKSFSIPSIEELPSSLSIDNHKAVYQCFVSSKVLDQDVNQDRSGFNSITFENRSSDDMFGNRLNIYNDVITAVSQYLDEYIAPYKKEKMELIRNYIESEAPEYRYIYRKHSPELSQIAYTTAKSKEKIGVELYRINQKINESNRAYIDSLSNLDMVDQEHINQIMESITDSAKAELASYVIRRKLVLDLLKKLLGQDIGKHYDENRLHRIFFPMKSDDLSIDYNQHNLWLIDERLAYSYRFFSDEPLKKAFVDTDSKLRPDGLFINAVAFSDSINGTASTITIVEFKKPGRDDFDRKNSPFTQIYDYIDIIKRKTVKGVEGETISVSDNTRFVAYVVADLTTSLLREIQRENLNPSINNQTYFGYNDSYKVYIEVLPYDVILDNSHKRNRVFFEKLIK